MGRKPRKKLEIDQNKPNDLLQEVYNDSHIIKAKLKDLFTKWENKLYQ